MTYLRRAVKYFIQITLIFVLIIGVLMWLGYVSRDVAVAFRHGWSSVGFIFAMFGIISLAYPFFGYGKRTVRAGGDPVEHWPKIDQAMARRGYTKKDSPEEGVRKYCLEGSFARAARLWEDTVTIRQCLGGFEAEGLVRDLARVTSSIDHSINNYTYGD